MYDIDLPLRIALYQTHTNIRPVHQLWVTEARSLASSFVEPFVAIGHLASPVSFESSARSSRYKRYCERQTVSTSEARASNGVYLARSSRDKMYQALPPLFSTVQRSTEESLGTRLDNPKHAG